MVVLHEAAKDLLTFHPGNIKWGMISILFSTSEPEENFDTEEIKIINKFFEELHWSE